MFDQYLYTPELSVQERIDRLEAAARRQFFFDTLRYQVTGVASQGQSINRNVQRPMRCHGATTDIANSRWMLTDTKGHSFTSDFVPVRSMTNFQSFINPWVPFPTPIELDADIQIKAQFINNGPVADANGNYRVILVCEEPNANVGRPALGDYIEFGRQYITSGAKPLPFDLMVNIPFTSSINERRNVQTLGQDDPLLLVGLTSELQFADVQIIQQSNNYAWSTDEIPIWCFSGDTKSARATVWLLPRPIYLPPKDVLTIAATNLSAEAAGQLNFICLRP